MLNIEQELKDFGAIKVLFTDASGTVTNCWVNKEEERRGGVCKASREEIISNISTLLSCPNEDSKYLNYVLNQEHVLQGYDREYDMNIHGKITLPNGLDMGVRCICGKPNHAVVYTYKIKETNEILLIGSDCVMYFCGKREEDRNREKLKEKRSKCPTCLCKKAQNNKYCGGVICVQGRQRKKGVGVTKTLPIEKAPENPEPELDPDEIWEKEVEEWQTLRAERWEREIVPGRTIRLIRRNKNQ